MRFLLIILLLVGAEQLHSQQTDSTISVPGLRSLNNKSLPPTIREITSVKPTFKGLIVPLTLITYGVISQSSEDLKEFDLNVKTEVREKDPDFRTHIDDYLQYTPGLSVYALNAVGIKGKNNFRDRTLTYFLANLMMGVTVKSVKTITKVTRPDGNGTDAFPSGHTATAFAGAEFLRQEYKDVSPWYGIAGYTVATATGILRMYNNKHWLRDVVAGAGFGILATQMAYWIYPVIERKLFRNKTNHSFQIMY